MRDSLEHQEELAGIMKASSRSLPPVRQQLLTADDRIVLFLIAGFLIISLIVHNNRHHLMDSISHFFQTKRRFGANVVPLKSDVFYSMLAIAVSCGSLALVTYPFVPKTNFPFGFSIYQLLLTITGVLLVWVYVKAVIYQFVDWVFSAEEEENHWISSYFLINSSSVFVTFPLATIVVFLKIDEVGVCIIMILLLFLYKMLLIYKLFSNFPAKKNGVFFIFLYFCSVEIVPALTVAHLMGVDATYSKVIF